MLRNVKDMVGFVIEATGEPNWTSEKLPVRLTREQVSASPSIETDKPVSRQYEQTYSGYYGYPNYWRSRQGPAST